MNFFLESIYAAICVELKLLFQCGLRGGLASVVENDRRRSARPASAKSA